MSTASRLARTASRIERLDTQRGYLIRQLLAEGHHQPYEIGEIANVPYSRIADEARAMALGSGLL